MSGCSSWGAAMPVRCPNQATTRSAIRYESTPAASVTSGAPSEWKVRPTMRAISTRVASSTRLSRLRMASPCCSRAGTTPPTPITELPGVRARAAA